MSVATILALAAGTYALRVTGTLVRARLARHGATGGDGHEAELPARLTEALSVGATVLLVALAVTATLTDGAGFAGLALPAGVLVGGVLAWRRTPFVLVIVASATVTAGLRALGVS